MSIYVGTSPKRVTEAYTRVEKILDRLTRETFPKRDLDSIKENFKGGILMGLDDMDARMSNIAKNELFLRDYVPVREICKLIDSVKPEDLQRVAQKHFVEAPRFGLLIAPECPSRLSGAFSK
jgi:predicted Zn-dependent peptidase